MIGAIAFGGALSLGPILAGLALWSVSAAVQELTVLAARLRIRRSRLDITPALARATARHATRRETP